VARYSVHSLFVVLHHIATVKDNSLDHSPLG
jgi:hypothetical protein